MISGKFCHRAFRIVCDGCRYRPVFLRVLQYRQHVRRFSGLRNADHQVALRQKAAPVERNAGRHCLRGGDPLPNGKQILAVNTCMVRGSPSCKKHTLYIFGLQFIRKSPQCIMIDFFQLSEHFRLFFYFRQHFSHLKRLLILLFNSFILSLIYDSALSWKL